MPNQFFSIIYKRFKIIINCVNISQVRKLTDLFGTACQARADIFPEKQKKN